jgi:hypothetical protein
MMVLIGDKFEVSPRCCFIKGFLNSPLVIIHALVVLQVLGVIPVLIVIQVLVKKQVLVKIRANKDILLAFHAPAAQKPNSLWKIEST